MKPLYITTIIGLLISFSYTQEIPINKGEKEVLVIPDATIKTGKVKEIKRNSEEISRLTIKRQKRKERLELMDKVDVINSDTTKTTLKR